MTMIIKCLDRRDGSDLGTIPVQEAAEKIAEALECDANYVRDGLLRGLAYVTAGCHYQITPDALADYRAATIATT